MRTRPIWLLALVICTFVLIVSLLAAVGSKQDFTLGTTPGNPAAGKIRIWANSATGTLDCLTSAGANCFGIGDLTHSGLMRLQGLTSGEASIGVPDVAGTAIIYMLPSTNGAADQILYDTGTATCGTFVTGAPSTCHQLGWMTLASVTSTFTNKTYNVESTGNVFSAPSVIVLVAGGCQNTTAISFWDLPTATPAVATCVTGTNIQKGVLAYADTSGGFSAQSSFAFPADWTTATLPDIDIYWTTTATSGNAKWTAQLVCTDVAASATDDPAFPTSGNGFNTVTTAAPGTASRVQTSTITAATLPTSCATTTKLLVHIRIFRDGNDGSDTIAATANLVQVVLTVRRAM